MRWIFLVTLLLGLFIGPFCPLAAAQAKDMDYCACDHPMSSAILNQDMGPAMPCCWVAPGQGQTADREAYKDFGQVAVVDFLRVLPDLGPAASSPNVRHNFEKNRDKFEERNCGKRE